MKMKLTVSNEKNLDWGKGDLVTRKENIDNANNVSTTTPVNHGYWIKRPLKNPVCSICGEIYTNAYGYKNPRWKYCPYCGAKMDEVTE